MNDLLNEYVVRRACTLVYAKNVHRNNYSFLCVGVYLR